MKKPFVYALVAVVYITFIVLAGNAIGPILQAQEDTPLMPITMLGVFVLSAAVMGFLFLSEPLRLFLENKKQEAFVFFAKILGIFACFVVLFVVVLLLR